MAHIDGPEVIGKKLVTQGSVVVRWPSCVHSDVSYIAWAEQ